MIDSARPLKGALNLGKYPERRLLSGADFESINDVNGGVLGAWVKFEGPRILVQESICRPLHLHIRDHDFRIYRLLGNRADKEASIFLVTVVISNGFLLAFPLNVEVSLDIGTLESATTFDRDWVSHQVSRDEAEQMIRLVELLDRLR